MKERKPLSVADHDRLDSQKRFDDEILHGSEHAVNGTRWVTSQQILNAFDYQAENGIVQSSVLV